MRLKMFALLNRYLKEGKYEEILVGLIKIVYCDLEIVNCEFSKDIEIYLGI